MRILIRYTIAKYNESGIVGIDLPDFDYMTASKIQSAIESGICDQYNNVDPTHVVIDALEYLGAIQVKPRTPNTISPLNVSKKCLACGGDHGASGLPCPTMTPMAKLL